MPAIDPLELKIARAIDAYRKDYPTLRVRRTIRALRSLADAIEAALRKAA